VWFEITNLLTPGRTTPKPATLTRGRDIGIRNGVRYAYNGNVHDVEGGSTWCHACGELLIGRDWIGSAPGT
jgi:hypothetical protein